MISLISISINLYNTLEISEEEQSRLEKEAPQAPKDRQCLGLALGMGVSPGTLQPEGGGGVPQALPAPPRGTELKAGLARRLFQGPNSRRVQLSKRKKNLSRLQPSPIPS